MLSLNPVVVHSEILSNFMVSLIPDDNINTVIDLSMGECALLESAKKRWNNASYLGSDIDEILLRKIHQKSPYIKTFLGDSLGNEINFWEEYYSIISKNGFDLALANPPFDFLNRKLVNIGSKNLLFPIEIHFLLKYIEIVREGGYICIILPYGFLSLELYNDLRIEILEKVVIHKIIKIFDNCFKKINTDICLLLLQKREKKSKSIQTNITVEYLDNNYNLQGHTRIDISQSKRFDLEYYHFLQEFQILQDSCKYPISILKEFIVNSKRGRTLANNKDLIVENGTRFLHTTDLKYLYISNKNKRYVKEKSQYFERNYVQIENILIGRVGRKCIGKIAIVTATFPPIIEYFLNKYLMKNNQNVIKDLDKPNEIVGEEIFIKKKFTNNEKIRHNLVLIDDEIGIQEILWKFKDNRDKKKSSKKILVICNTIKKAQEIYSKLKIELEDYFRELDKKKTCLTSKREDKEEKKSDL